MLGQSNLPKFRWEFKDNFLKHNREVLYLSTLSRNKKYSKILTFWKISAVKNLYPESFAFNCFWRLNFGMKSFTMRKLRNKTVLCFVYENRNLAHMYTVVFFPFRKNLKISDLLIFIGVIDHAEFENDLFKVIRPLEFRRPHP